MSASSSDKASLVQTGGLPAPAIVQADRTAGSTDLSLDTTLHWPTGSGIKFATFTLDQNTGKPVIGSQQDWAGVVSGTTISGLRKTSAGADAGNVTNDRAIMMPTGAWGEEFVEAFLAQHSNPNGAHTDVTATTVATSGNITGGADALIAGDIQHRNVSLETIRTESTQNYVASGCVVSQTTGLSWTMTAGVVYIDGRRYVVAGTSGSVSASKDTYFDLVGAAGTVTVNYTGGNSVANAATAPALPAHTIRIAALTSNGSAITVVTLSWSDNIANPIYPNTPTPVVGGVFGMAGDIVRAGGWAIPTLDTIFQTFGGMILASGGIKIPVKGMYRVMISFCTQDGDVNATMIGAASTNATPGSLSTINDVSTGRVPRAANPQSANVTGLAKYNAGDIVYFHQYSGSGTSVRIKGSGALDYSVISMELVKALP